MHVVAFATNLAAHYILNSHWLACNGTTVNFEADGNTDRRASQR